MEENIDSSQKPQRVSIGAPGELHRKTLRIAFVTLLLSTLYAVFRYNILGSVPIKDIPLFVFNKGISLSSLVLLTASFSISPLTNLGLKIPSYYVNSRHVYGMIGFILTLIHVFMSLILFNPVMYAKFFLENGSLTFTGGLSILGGILSIAILWFYNWNSQHQLKESKLFNQFTTSRKLILTTLFFVAVHLFFMGYKNWISPSTWQGGLPPISLISFVVFSIGFTINIFGRK